MAEYDNTILQTDKTLKLLYNRYRNTNTIIVFRSDHGNEMYDYRDKEGRLGMDDNYKAEYLHCLHDVPAFVWCSDKYMQKHPQVVERLENAVKKRGMSDKIGYLVMSLSGISSKYYYANRDMLNDAYVATKRDVFLNSLNRTTHRISENGVSLDYDSIMND